LIALQNVDSADLQADHRAGYLHAHFARHGCYAARVDRIGDLNGDGTGY